MINSNHINDTNNVSSSSRRRSACRGPGPQQGRARPSTPVSRVVWNSPLSPGENSRRKNKNRLGSSPRIARLLLCGLGGEMTYVGTAKK